MKKLHLSIVIILYLISIALFFNIQNSKITSLEEKTKITKKTRPECLKFDENNLAFTNRCNYDFKFTDFGNCEYLTEKTSCIESYNKLEEYKFQKDYVAVPQNYVFFPEIKNTNTNRVSIIYGKSDSNPQACHTCEYKNSNNTIFSKEKIKTYFLGSKSNFIFNIDGKFSNYVIEGNYSKGSKFLQIFKSTKNIIIFLFINILFISAIVYTSKQ